MSWDDPRERDGQGPYDDDDWDPDNDPSLMYWAENEVGEEPWDASEL